MHILLVGINARYVHTNLAIRLLKEALLQQNQQDWQISMQEYSINEQLEQVAAQIFQAKPDLVGFSCYIWNISMVQALLRRLRLVLPQTLFLAGGPEVSYDPRAVLAQTPELDMILPGEGEDSFPLLVQALSGGGRLDQVPGLVWRSLETNENPQASCPLNMNTLPNPYHQAENLQGKLVYVETSRGCPFECQFCLSSIARGVRYLDPERFRILLQSLFQQGARTIKFVDRTFNARKQHAFRILEVFREEAALLPDLPRAHCEMAGELLDQQWLDYLQDYPEGLLQLEIGVQSTHQPTLDAVKRPQHFQRWQDKVQHLQHTCHIPIHLDLIAGLPLEDWQSFRRSFDQVFAVRPNHLQLGFLKVLKGSAIWEKSQEYGLSYSPDPPYTILQTRELSHQQLLALSRLEEILERTYNTGRFLHTLEVLLQEQESAFDFFHGLAEYWQEKGWFRREFSPKGLMENLAQYLTDYDLSQTSHPPSPLWREALRFDYYLMERPGSVPDFLLPDAGAGQETHAIGAQEQKRIEEQIKNHPSWQEILPQGRHMDRRQWARSTAVASFATQVPMLLPDVTKGAPPTGNQTWYLFFYGGKKPQYWEVPSHIYPIHS